MLCFQMQEPRSPMERTIDTLRFPFGPDFQAILALVGDAVICTDEYGRIVLFNRSSEVYFGYTAAEVLGLSLEVLILARFQDQHREDYNRFFAVDVATRRAMAAGREILGRRKDGTELAVEVSLSRQHIDGAFHRDSRYPRCQRPEG